MVNKVNSEDHPEYAIDNSQQEIEDMAIASALKILEVRLSKDKNPITSPEDTKNFLRLKLAANENEVFSCLFLDTRHRVIEYKEMFNGTVDSCSVYPRVIVKEALNLNASAVIFAHNHPSGDPKPSHADRNLTERLKNALSLVDIRVLDHIVVGAEGSFSLAEKGMM